MRLFDRLRDWALRPIVRQIETSGNRAALYLHEMYESLRSYRDDDRRMIQGLVEAVSPCRDGSPSPLLQVLRAEPALAFKQWLDESKDRDRETRRQFQDREKQLLARWAEHSASQAARIDVMERTIVKLDDRVTELQGATNDSQ